MTETYINGWKSHQIDPSVDNPYNEVTQRYSYDQWNSGWCARYNACKHNLDLSLDYEC